MSILRASAKPPAERTNLTQASAGVASWAADCQPGNYRVRGRLNDIPHRDKVKSADAEFGAVGVKTSLRPTGATAKATFTSDGSPALLEHRFGKGRAVTFATTPRIGYLKDAKFVAGALAEKWPVGQRRALTRYATEAGAAPLVKLSEPVVESGVYDAPAGTALVLANFTYEPIKSLRVEMPTRAPVAAVKSLSHGPIAFETVAAPSPWRKEGYTHRYRFALPLGHDDLILLEPR